MLHVICFSHRRQLQLHGYLESLIHYTKVQNIHVLYPKQDYECVRKSLPAVSFVQEDPDFHTTLRDLVCITKEPFIMFGCDDMVFTRTVDMSEVCHRLDSHHQILGYSTRLHDKLPGAPMSTFWEWPKYSPSGYWGYPFDLSGTIYRTGCIKNLLANIGHQKSPNTFESNGKEFMDDCLGNHYPLFSRGEFPSCIIQQVNNVQTTVPINEAHYKEEHTPERLEELYRSGKRLDWKNAAGAIRGHVWTNDFWRVQ